MIYLAGVAAIVCLVCLIMVILRMFGSGNTTLGVITIVASLCCGVGTFIALIWGWMNATKLNMKNLMIVYTIAFLVYWALSAYSLSTGAIEIPQMPNK